MPPPPPPPPPPPEEPPPELLPPVHLPQQHVKVKKRMNTKPTIPRTRPRIQYLKSTSHFPSFNAFLKNKINKSVSLVLSKTSYQYFPLYM